MLHALNGTSIISGFHCNAESRHALFLSYCAVSTREKMKSSVDVDFLGIGAPKCGTTWLFHALGQHPRICLSEPKEVNYFNTEDFSLPLESVEAGAVEYINQNHKKTIAWYNRFFRHCAADTIKGEFSPTYYCDRDAVRRIRRHFPDAKLLVCLRKPADCLYAIYWARRRYRKIETNETFEKALAADRRYLNYGYFGKHLEKVFHFFDASQVKVVLLDDIAGRPEATIREVYGFLDLEPDVPLDLKRIPKNAAKKSGPLSLEAAMRRFSAFMIRHDQAVLLRRLRRLGLREAALKLSTVETRYPEMRAETRMRLSDEYCKDLVKLEQLLGRDLDAWK